MIHNFTLILILFLLHQPVTGDKALITQLCDKWTPFPDACYQCLNNSIDVKNEKELAGISISCAISLSEVVSLDLDGIAQNSGDNAIKELCASCKKIIDPALLSSLDQAVMIYGYGHFADAAEQMKRSYFIYWECSELAKKIPAPPAKFSDDFFNTLQYNILNAHDILTKISGAGD